MFRKSKSYGLFLFFVLPICVSAQIGTFKTLPISVAYYGENGFHPGFKVGTFYNLWSAEKTKHYRLNKRTVKFGLKQNLKELNLDFNLGMYSHPNNHTGYLANTGLTFLRTKLRKQRQLGIGLEIGYLRRMNKFETFELNEEGKVSKVRFAGNNALVFGLAPQFGKEFMLFESQSRIFFKPILQYFKYGSGWQPNANLEIGLVVNINRKKTETR